MRRIAGDTVNALGNVGRLLRLSSMTQHENRIASAWRWDEARSPHNGYSGRRRSHSWLPSQYSAIG